MRDHGTLFQLRKLINRRNVKKDPSKSVASCEEFFLLVVEAHILVAAMKLFNMSALTDKPNSPTFFPEGSSELDSLKRKEILMLGLRKLINKYVNLDLTFKELVVSRKRSSIDSVNEYALEVMSLGLLLSEFNERVMETGLFVAGGTFYRCLKLPIEQTTA